MTKIKKPSKTVLKRSPIDLKTESPLVPIPTGYKQFLEDLKNRIRSSQIKAAVKVNSELISMYWQIGKDIVERQKKEDWGSGVIERLGRDLQNSFPSMDGFSGRNLRRMKLFYQTYSQQIWPQAVATLDDDGKPNVLGHIPWGHNAILMEKVKDNLERLWYAQQAIENGWSRNMLDNWIKSDLYKRQGKAVTNFQSILPKPQSDLAEQSIKDPYIFDFLTLADDAKEKDIERELLNHVQKFLIELGKGFAFVGRQVPLRMDDADYYIDLLFFHYKLNCFVVVELKNTAFKPDYAGKMAFYLAVVDKCLKEDSHNRTIGMILCQKKNTFTVEYALKYNSSPIGVSSYETELIKKLPKDLKSSLPTIEEIEAELEKETK